MEIWRIALLATLVILVALVLARVRPSPRAMRSRSTHRDRRAPGAGYDVGVPRPPSRERYRGQKVVGRPRPTESASTSIRPATVTCTSSPR